MCLAVRVPSPAFPIKTEITQPIENGMTFIHLISTITMLVVIHDSICAAINSKAVLLFHTWCRQLIVLYTSMNDDKHEVRLILRIPNVIK